MSFAKRFLVENHPGMVFLDPMLVRRCVTLVLLALLTFLSQAPNMFAAGIPETGMKVYFGTYTGSKSRGIYLSQFDTASGKLTVPELAAEMKNPSFLAVDLENGCLYAVGEVGDYGGKAAGAVSSFRIENTGRLTPLNTQPSGGTGPCHLALDRKGKCLLVANYNSGSLAVFPVQPDGSLGNQSAAVQHHGSSVNPQRQEGPHAHFVLPDPKNRFVLACDLGLDQVIAYRLEASHGTLQVDKPVSCPLPPGSGPRHLAFHPNGRFVYVINELSSTIAVFEYSARHGELKQVEVVSTLSPNFRGNNTCAELQVHPSGKFVYASNRGDNTIATFSVNQQHGRLTLFNCEPSGGKTPRHFTLDPSGKWLVAENQDSDNVVIFHLDATNGHPVATGDSVGLGAPVCAVFAR